MSLNIRDLTMLKILLHGRSWFIFLWLVFGYEGSFMLELSQIIRRANELENPLTLNSRFCQEYLDDMTDPHCLTPTHQPRIINNDCAYTINGDVYFAVDKSPNYDRLSEQKLGDNKASERVVVDSRKRNPADFAFWDSPWGPGRPGWHIECSAMSAHYLTFKFDIQGGGIDLIFPHHENEIAQSCAACQENNVSYWMHNGHITDLYHPLALRYFYLGTHCRSPINYSIAQLEIYCEDTLSLFQQVNGRNVFITPTAQDCIRTLQTDFQTKMSDDLSTPHILNASLQEALRFINSFPHRIRKRSEGVLSILGLLSTLAYSERAGMIEDDVLHLIEERALARKNKDFSKGNQIRANLASKDISNRPFRIMTALLCW
ncbi:hypothetical protein AAG906_039357 [Vitis piasezkii]